MIFLRRNIITFFVVSAFSSHAMAELEDYGLPFPQGGYTVQMENTTALSVDKGVVLEQAQNSASSVPVSKPSATTTRPKEVGNNFTATAGASHNANASDNPAVDGKNIQPVPSNMVQPIRLTDSNIPSRQEIITEPGVNTLVPIAIGQINRIVTPFERPTVQKLKLENVRVTIEGNVLYVYTSSTQPVALYISEKGDESVSLSLSLIPQKIAPVQATLMVSRKLNSAVSSSENSSSMMYGGSEVKAKRWEQKDTYVETIRNILRTIALGDIPPGYAMGNLSSGVSVPNCNFSTGTNQDHIKYSFAGGQLIQGSQFIVVVGVAQNTGSSTVTVDESLCTHPRMAARALWSRNTLEPGQKTEAYFVLRNGQREVRSNDSIRPKLAE